MLVKICGITTSAHALAAARAGANLIGLVFAPSRRRVAYGQAAQIVAELRAMVANPPQIAALFVNALASEIEAAHVVVGFDLVQLSGDEPPTLADELDLPLWKAIRLTNDPNEQAWQALAARKRATLLVDAHVAGVYGGSGVQADWPRAAALAREVPVILAGGLNPANVGAAISAVRPLGVDVSSGVERDGHKDSALIAAFVAAARATSAQAEP